MSSNTHKLSLPAAIFIAINIILGTGTFINTVVLAQKIGSLGPLLYLFAGLLMFPLVLCIARLSAMHTEGNFLTFGALLNPYWGFINIWIYAIAKLGSASLSIHVFNTFLQHIFPSLTALPTLYLDLFIVMLFVILNTFNVRTGSRIQYGFVFMKMVPLLTAIVLGLYAFDKINIGTPHQIWSGFPLSIPIALFCCLGFEAICSLASVIENSQKNTPRAIMISFAAVVTIAATYQFLFYAALGSTLAAQTNYTGAFPALLMHVFPGISTWFSSFISVAIATSALGGAYGIMYTNLWNYYSLAQQFNNRFSLPFTFLNKHKIPVLCVIAEGAIATVYLTSSGGAQIPLQYTSVLGCIITYTICVLGYFNVTRSLLGILGFMTCLLLLATSFYGFIQTSMVPLIIFAIISIIGSLLYYLKEKKII